tara:strand:- start:119 stop:379 length:261 start_codon:yes stop_codon:yes gene_type:complete
MKNNNKLIAEFMGLNIDKGVQADYMEHELKYHESWDWLRPVVIKIEQDCEGVPQEMLNISLYSDINEVYEAVVTFIKEYNNETGRQ